MSLLTVKNVKKVYTTRFGTVRVQALNDVNFSVEEGEYVAIMGESGSGKTTLLNILASLDTATSGQVLLNGQEISRVSQKDLCAFRRAAGFGGGAVSGDGGAAVSSFREAFNRRPSG